MLNIFVTWRKAMKLSEAEAADLLDVGNAMTLSRYRQGQVPNSQVLLHMMRLALNRDEDAFVSWIMRLASQEEQPTRPTVENTGMSKARKVRTRGKAREEQPEARDDATDGLARLKQAAAKGRRLAEARKREREED